MLYHIYPLFPGPELQSGQKLVLRLLATIALAVVSFHTDAPIPALLPFLNASWKSCSVRMFSTAYSSVVVVVCITKKKELNSMV
jgi:hypothetical protein